MSSCPPPTRERENVMAACQAHEAVFDRLYAAEVDTCWTCLEEAADAIRRCSKTTGHADSEYLHTLLLMIINCVSDISAALMSMREGFHFPSGTNLRAIVESLACVVT